MRALIGIIACSFVGCAQTPTRPADALCREIVEFANSVPINTTESVHLETAWGSDLSGNTASFFEKQCDFHEYEHGRRLCKFLMEKTSTEFMGINIDRVLTCLNGTAVTDSRGNYVVKELQGKVEATAAIGLDENVSVVAEFSTSATGTNPFLKISSSRVSE